MTKVTVVDYGSGNVFAVSRALMHCGGDVELTADTDRVANAERLILPGVGAFHSAWQLLKERDLLAPIRAFTETGRPFLGICVGMQLMLEEGTEFGHHEGFGFTPGRVEKISDVGADGAPHPVPRVGWYALNPGQASWQSTALKNIDGDDSFYFVHSYAAMPSDRSHIVADSDYNGQSVTAAVGHDNLLGVQFHPERSGTSGMKILRTFLESL